MSLRSGLLARRKLCWGLVSALWALLPVPLAAAHGLGGHVAGGWGDSGHAQAGVTWDTSVARDRAFNYRLSVAYETFTLEEDQGDERLSGLLLENTFGFQLAATGKARTWLGPQLLFGVYEEELGAGFGLAFGRNWHVSDAMSLGLAGGARGMIYGGPLGDDESEVVGFLRGDLFWRTAGDRPPR